MKRVIKLPLTLIGLYLFVGIILGLWMFIENSGTYVDDSVAAAVFWPYLLFWMGGHQSGIISILIFAADLLILFLIVFLSIRLSREKSR
ncbi:MAG: hypothetical protein WC979_03490 [Candidatus Pacearchaeota archaeon]